MLKHVVHPKNVQKRDGLASVGTNLDACLHVAPRFRKRPPMPSTGHVDWRSLKSAYKRSTGEKWLHIVQSECRFEKEMDLAGLEPATF